MRGEGQFCLLIEHRTIYLIIKGCMDLGCLDFFLSVTLVTNTALLGIVTNLGGETNMRGVVTNMMDCD